MLIFLEFTYVKFICHFIFSYHRRKEGSKEAKINEAVYLEQTESSSDNDSEFSDTSSKSVEVSGLSWQISKYINKVNNIFCIFCLDLYVTGEKRQRSESNDSNQSDEDLLPQKLKVSKERKSFESSSYDISIGRGKEPADGRLTKEKECHQNVNLHFCL